EGRRKKEEGRRKKDEGRRKEEEGRRKKEEGRRKREGTTRINADLDDRAILDLRLQSRTHSYQRNRVFIGMEGGDTIFS
ncbi:MAG: hypothetical protein HC849_25740, partial [Oscillatoriales cyanobacterium RU_3_3]|nr:hypothetical protein [Oscillatoriales cyanobacterium RU_3_3]